MHNRADTELWPGRARGARRATTRSRRTARELARQCVLDYYGVALAGADDALVRILLDETAEAGGARRPASSATEARLPALSAALVNGAAATRSITTTSTWRCRAIRRSRSCRACWRSPNCRKAPAARSSPPLSPATRPPAASASALRPGHYERGFHATGTVGAFGAAAACAHLLGLDAEATARALGIAGTQAAGLKSQFGTMCKPFHAGKAAQNGLLAARLAARGFSSRTDLVECEQGFAADPRPRLPPGGGARRAAERLPHLRQSLQVPRRLLHDARADRVRPRSCAKSTA